MTDHHIGLPLSAVNSSVWPGNVTSHGKRDCCKGQTGQALQTGKRTAKDTLLLSDIGLTNVTQKARMSGAAIREVLPGVTEAQLAVYGQPHIRGVGILLAVVFPPADGAKSHRVGGLQSLVTTAGTAKTSCDSLHVPMDENHRQRDYIRTNFCHPDLRLTRSRLPAAGDSMLILRRLATKIPGRGVAYGLLSPRQASGGQNLKTRPVLNRAGVPPDGLRPVAWI